MKKFYVKLIILLSVVIVISVNAMAKETDPEIVLDDVVVTATRTNELSDLTPASVSVITKEDIEKFNVQTLDEALRYEVGVYQRVGTGILNTSKPISIRGIPGEKRTLIMLNGLPINSGFNGSVCWSDLSVENVEKIEVVRGPGSALYGGNAMGGVVNIITSVPKGPEYSFRAGYGSQESYNVSVSAGDRFYDKFSIRIGSEVQDTQGYPTYLRHMRVRDGDGDLTGGWASPSNTGRDYWVIGDRGDMTAQNWNINLMTVLDYSDTGQARFEIQHGRHKSEYDHPHTYIKDASGDASWDGDIDSGENRRTPVEYDDFMYGNRKSEEHFTTPAISFSDQFGVFSVSGKVGYQYWDRIFGEEDTGSGDTYSNAPGSLFDADYRAWIGDVQSNMELGSRHQLTFGTYYRLNDYTRRTYELDYFRDLDDKGERQFAIRGKDVSYAFYAQDAWQIHDTLRIYLGLRWDTWRAFDAECGDIGEVESIDSYDDNHLSPKLSSLWNPLSDTYIRCSIGNAFRAPNIYELYYLPSSSYVSNPDIKPETMWNYEIGSDQYFINRSVKFSATYFHSEIKNFISRRRVDGIRMSDNYSEAKVDGIELSGFWTPMQWMTLWGNYAYNKTKITKDKTDPDVEGNRLAGVPSIIANLGLEFSFDQLRVNLGGNYLGREYTSSDNDDKDDLRGGYAKRWLWNTKISVMTKDWIELSLSIDNIFDTDNYEWVYMERGRFTMGEVKITW